MYTYRKLCCLETHNNKLSHVYPYLALEQKETSLSTGTVTKNKTIYLLRYITIYYMCWIFKDNLIVTVTHPDYGFRHWAEVKLRRETRSRIEMESSSLLLNFKYKLSNFNDNILTNILFLYTHLFKLLKNVKKISQMRCLTEVATARTQQVLSIESPTLTEWLW